MSYMSTLHVISMDWKQCNYLSTGNLIKYTVRHWYNGIRHSCLNQCTCLDIATYMSTYMYPLVNKAGHNHVCTLQCHWYQNCVLVTQSCRLFVTPWTEAHQAPLSMGFSRQEYWKGLPFPSPSAWHHLPHVRDMTTGYKIHFPGMSPSDWK